MTEAAIRDDMDMDSVSAYISRETLAWIEPLWRKEREEALELTSANSALNMFSNSSDEEDSEDGWDSGTMESRSITISGVHFHYVCDISASGHGNEVWCASVALCQYIEKIATEQDLLHKREKLRCLELGAGAAIPSLFLGNYISQQLHVNLPILVHITDLQRFHNIKPILLAVGKQPDDVRQKIEFKVSPHYWGTGVGTSIQSNTDELDSSFLENECGGSNMYDVILVSDCIYDPTYHQELLNSICATLRKPNHQDGKVDDRGGRVIVTFSIHGNVPEENVWEFFRKATDKGLIWKEAPQNSEGNQEGRSGRHMEQSMRDLGIFLSNMDPKRWIVHVYELNWPVD